MKNEKFIYILLLFFLFLTFFKTAVSAESNYVLPYPSIMPGNLSYKIHLVYEKISRYWYFGDFGQFDYSLKMADKYLIEAKTLFEYKQYLLGYRALQNSDTYFPSTLSNLMRAKENNKNIVQKRILLREAAQKHIEVLEKIQKENPDVFDWQPEKSIPTTLDLKYSLNKSIKLREESL